MKSVKLTLSAALLGLALGGCGTEQKNNNPALNTDRGNGGNTIGTVEQAKRTNVSIDEDLAKQLGLDLKNNCVVAVGDLAQQALVELHGRACDSKETKSAKFELKTELAAVKKDSGKQQQEQGKTAPAPTPAPVVPGKQAQGKVAPDLSPRLYYLVLTTTRRSPVQTPEQGKVQQEQGKTPAQQQGKTPVTPVTPVTPSTPSQQQGKVTPLAPIQKAPEQGKVAPKFREVTVTARVGEIVVMPEVRIIPSKAPEQGKVQEQGKQQQATAPVQKAPEQGKQQAPVVPAPVQKAPVQAPVQKAPEQGKQQQAPVQKAPEQGKVQEQGKTGEQGQVQQTEVVERVVLTKLCTAGRSGASYSGVCRVNVENGMFKSIDLLPGQGEEVKGSEKIVEEKPLLPEQGKTQGQQAAPAQKAPEQGKVTQAPVPAPKAPVTQAPVQKAPEQGKVQAPKAPVTPPAPKQAEQPKQDQRSSQQGPKKAA